LNINNNNYYYYWLMRMAQDVTVSWKFSRVDRNSMTQSGAEIFHKTVILTGSTKKQLRKMVKPFYGTGT
jgi:hypothetical protein